MLARHPRARLDIPILVATVLALLGASAMAAAQTVRGDFDGDGFADLAIGSPNEVIAHVHGAGAVTVLYGTARPGLSVAGNQRWHQNVDGIDGIAEHNDHFGSALAVGDFDGDGYSDLVVGVVGEGIGETAAAGVVHVIYGTLDGLAADRSQVWQQGSDGLAETAEDGDGFGATLATGDFNGDGYDDLAIGVPAEDLGSGIVQVLYGSEEEGLTADGNQVWFQDFFGLGVLGEYEAGDEFGFALETSDFNGDGFDDLAVGVPGEDLQAAPLARVTLDAGAVNVIYGSWPRLIVEGNQLWHQDSEDEFPDHVEVLGQPDEGDRFGSALAAGDFDGDLYDDLAIGVPGEVVQENLLAPGVRAAGAVNVLYGFHEGLVVERNQFYHQDIRGILEVAEMDDHYGVSLAAGDFDGDGYDDLAVGIPGEERRGIRGAGAVNVLYGLEDRGLDPRGNQIWTQGAFGLRESLGLWDQFGQSLAADDFNGDGLCDLAVGAFNETVGPDLLGAGSVSVLYGRRIGLDDRGNQLWHQNVVGLGGRAALFEEFGFALGR